MSWTLATFNVNGVRARLAILQDWLAQHRPQVACLQETKVPDDAFPAAAFEELGYTASFQGQKSYNGVAILTTVPPEEVQRGFPDGWNAAEARFISLKTQGVRVVNVYAPQGKDPADPAYEHKLEFFGRLTAWLRENFSPGDPLVLCGDLNVAPTDLDLFDPAGLAGSVGCQPAERAALAELAAWGLEDLFRRHHPEDKQFSFWDYRLPNGFKRNLGWRIDHILATPPLAGLSLDCWVDTGPRALPKPSDHTPVLAEFAD
ncbi:MAG: exodeoxyribonuclease III [Deltaproteobacteria bacterium]|nr:exodeoxyribonuclease III [Deltaproteobacteria bacterium]